MRVLFDQATPVPIRRYLERHEVRTAAAVPGSFTEIDFPPERVGDDPEHGS